MGERWDSAPWDGRLAEHGRSALKGVDINRGEPQSGPPCGGVVARNTPLPHSCYPAAFGLPLSQTVGALLRRST